MTDGSEQRAANGQERNAYDAHPMLAIERLCFHAGYEMRMRALPDAVVDA